MFRLTENVFCAFCKLPRKVYRANHVGWTNVLLSAALAVLLMLAIWQAPDGRALILFTVFVLCAEIFVYFRWRISVRCPHCAFDPVLYKSDRQKCVGIVKERLDDLRSSGRYLLKHNNPFTHLPVQPKPEKDVKDRFLSRHI